MTTAATPRRQEAPAMTAPAISPIVTCDVHGAIRTGSATEAGRVEAAHRSCNAGDWTQETRRCGRCAADIPHTAERHAASVAPWVPTHYVPTAEQVRNERYAQAEVEPNDPAELELDAPAYYSVTLDSELHELATYAHTAPLADVTAAARRLIDTRAADLEDAAFALLGDAAYGDEAWALYDTAGRGGELVSTFSVRDAEGALVYRSL